MSLSPVNFQPSIRRPNQTETAGTVAIDRISVFIAAASNSENGGSIAYGGNTSSSSSSSSSSSTVSIA